MSSPRVALKPQFLEGSAGPTFCLFLRPHDGDGERAVLLLPPFGEEMNRSRPMMVRLARSLTERGCGALILDPFGTGDSAGDFSHARWQIWQGDALAALDWLSDKGYVRLHLAGLRTGANLALATCTQHPVESTILWQPILKGEAFLNQLLRVRVAAGLSASGSASKETTKELRSRLKAGEEIEVAGYTLTPGLAEEISHLNLVTDASTISSPINWFDVASVPSNPTPPAISAALKALSEAQVQVSFERVEGEPFWTIEEPVHIASLIDRTVVAVCAAAKQCPVP